MNKTKEDWEIKYNELVKLIPTLPLLEILERQKKMYDLIPPNVSLNDFGLCKMIEERFKDTEEWRIHKNNNIRKYVINIKDISEDQTYNFVKNNLNGSKT